MIDYVLWGSAWQDPGALASGSPYGSPMNLTSSVLTTGALAVDTTLATPKPYPPNPPGYVVTYSITDPVTNKQYSAKRYIYVICSSSEKICVDPSTSATICTTNGACINAQIGRLNQTGEQPKSIHFMILHLAHRPFHSLLSCQQQQPRLPASGAHPPGSSNCLHRPYNSLRFLLPVNQHKGRLRQWRHCNRRPGRKARPSDPSVRLADFLEHWHWVPPLHYHRMQVGTKAIHARDLLAQLHSHRLEQPDLLGRPLSRCPCLLLRRRAALPGSNLLLKQWGLHLIF